MSEPVVLITGASQGIGAELARAFAREEHAKVALLARSEDKLHRLAGECRALGGDALVVPCDVTDAGAVARHAEVIVDTYGLPDVVVNNAGLFEPGSIVDTAPDEFRRQVDVNLNGAFYVTHQFLQLMLDRGSGDIFFMASVASIKGYPGGVGYCAAKHGLLGLARATREETKDSGVRSTAIILGATWTPSWEGVDLPPDRFIPPEDVTDTVLAICKISPRAVVEEILIRPRAGDV